MKYKERGARGRKAGRKNGRRAHRAEGLIAAAALAMVLMIAFFINSFFFGFDIPQVASGESKAPQTVYEAGMGQHSYPQAETQRKLPEDWKLTLVDAEHPVQKETVGEMTVLRHDRKVDSRIYPSLQEMFDEMRRQGLTPVVSDGYHTREEHLQILQSLEEAYRDEGNSYQKARDLALAAVGAAGANEHELGICVDIVSEQEDPDSTAAVKEWLEMHSWEYGFIRRYPEDEAAQTGITGEPDHYRYVGMEAARIIFARDLTLEEYLYSLR